MAAENQRGEIYTHHLHPTEGNLLTSTHQPGKHINQANIPQTETVKYLDLHFDKRLTWREHATKTRKHLDLKTRELTWLTGKRSPLSLTNKILIYKTVLKQYGRMDLHYGAVLQPPT